MSTNNNKKKYRVWNHVSDDGDSIYAAPLEDLPGGQTYVLEDKMRDLINEELDKRFGKFNKEVDDN